MHEEIDEYSHSEFTHGKDFFERFEELAKVPFEEQVWLLNVGKVKRMAGKVTIVSDAEIFGMFKNTYEVRSNRGKSHYIARKKDAYIVYDKKTNKVRAGNPRVLKDHFLEFFYGKSSLIEEIFPEYPTTAILKRVIEGKIKTIGDLLNFEKTYSLRNKNIPNDIFLNLKISNISNFQIKFINNFDLFNDEDNCRHFRSLSTHHLEVTGVRINVLEDLNYANLHQKYDECNKKLTQKYDTKPGDVIF